MELLLDKDLPRAFMLLLILGCVRSEIWHLRKDTPLSIQSKNNIRLGRSSQQLATFKPSWKYFMGQQYGHQMLMYFPVSKENTNTKRNLCKTKEHSSFLERWCSSLIFDKQQQYYQ
jgi:hypothetical protein